MPEAARDFAQAPYAEEVYGFMPVLVPELRAVIASELAEDELIRKRAELLARQAAYLAVNAEVETYVRPSPSRYSHLLEATQAAAKGDAEANEFLDANVSTDVIERSVKAGHVKEVDVDTDEDGRIIQHGQYLDDVHSNTLIYGSDDPEMRGRFHVDVRNGKRAEHFNRTGQLETHYLMEVSQVADLPEDELKAAGFFTDTMSWIIRLWSSEKGQLKMVSAFVAGVTEPGGERRDYDMVKAIGDAIDVDYRGMTATEVLDQAVLVPKEMFPDGIIDPVRIADDVNGTFFGQNKPRQDYHEYLEQCCKREAELEPTVRQIKADLIAAAPYLKTPDEATAKLHDLSEKHLVQRSLTDRQIDPRVFGTVAAEHIHQARYWLSIGDLQQAERSMVSAEKTAVSSSCPDGKSGNTAADMNGKTNSRTEKSEKSGIKKMTCPFCKDPNQYGDPCSPNQHCTNCNARVVNGEVKSEGDGGRKAREKRAAQRVAEFGARRRQSAAERSKNRREAGER